VAIERLGHRGDGIGRTAEGPVHVPHTLPGEVVRIERNGDRGRLVEILTPSSARISPLCRHFGACGGCALQMMPLADSRLLKREFVRSALRRQGLDAPVEATIGIPPASRRRAVLTALKAGECVRLGYRERRGDRLVEVEACPVLAPALEAAFEPVRAVSARLLRPGETSRVVALLTTAGIDLALDRGAAHAADLAALARVAEAGGLARLSLAGEPVVTLAEPAVLVAGVSVVPPPGAFLQASADAEAAMTALVCEHLQAARKAADLFSGIGTFALALARRASVRAAEADAAALDALRAAARRASGLKPVAAERRDLFADPLSPADLADVDGVVFDPPRAGARAQAEALAASRVPSVAAISCDPATFARDARILVGGGYRLERVVPIDQFVHSAATEVVGLFRRPRR
jgi:23S rRNA (uracil1939-C5)-methyltransferase